MGNLMRLDFGMARLKWVHATERETKAVGYPSFK